MIYCQRDSKEIAEDEQEKRSTSDGFVKRQDSIVKCVEKNLPK
jgi:hypothetical protein